MNVVKELLEVGEYKAKNTHVDPEELAAWSIVANTIMNLDSSYMIR